MAILIHKINVFVSGGNPWYDDSNYYNSCSGCDDINTATVVFGQKEAWNLYRKEVQRIRREYESFSWRGTIGSALLSEGAIISGRKSDYFPGDGYSALHELKWELVDSTRNMHEG